MSDDVTVRILTEIRDAVRGTNERVDQTNLRVDQLRTELRAEIAETNQRLDRVQDDLGHRIDRVREDLGHRIVETELRLATQFVEMTAASRDVHKLLIDRFDLRDRVERVEHDVAELKKRSS